MKAYGKDTKENRDRNVCSNPLNLTTIAAVALALVVMSWSQKGTAQEVQVTGPLKGAPAVHHLRLFREGRFQFFPQVNFTLQDQFSRTIMVGGQLSYHLTDWLGIGVWGTYGIVDINTDLTDRVQKTGQTTMENVLSLPSANNYPNQIGHIEWMAAGQVNFIPLRGKLSLFQDIFLDTDFYVFGGVAAVGLSERADNDGSCVAAANNDLATAVNLCGAQVSRAKRTLIAPTFGVGLNVYGSSFFGIGIEWRAVPFSWNTSGTDEGGPSGEFPDGRINSDDRVFHFNHMITLGAVFHFPTSTKVTD